MDFEFSVGGYNIKGWMVAVALPVLSTVAGGVYWSYDTLQRFYGVEAGIAEVVDKSASFDVKAGSLDNSSWLEIESSFWSVSACKWDPINNSIPSFEKNPT